MRRLIGLVVYCMIVQILAIVAVQLGDVQPALAGREDPPQPGIVTRVLGGTEHFREGVVVWELRLEIPAEYHPAKDGKWIYEKGMEIPQGTRLKLYVLVHYGQAQIDGATLTQIHVSNPGASEGFRLLHESRMGWVKSDVVVDRWADEPMAFRVYLSPDGKHLNAYDFIMLRIAGRDTIFRRFGITPPARPEDARVPEDYPKGRVTVRSDKGQAIASATIVVTLDDGREIEYATRQDLPGVYTFEGVPTGVVRIRPSTYQGERKWYLLGPPKLLRQSLQKGATIEFTLTQDP